MYVSLQKHSLGSTFVPFSRCSNCSVVRLIPNCASRAVFRDREGGSTRCVALLPTNSPPPPGTPNSISSIAVASRSGPRRYGVSQEEIDSIQLESLGAREASTAMGQCPDRSAPRGGADAPTNRPPEVAQISKGARERAAASVVSALLAVPNLAQARHPSPCLYEGIQPPPHWEGKPRAPLHWFALITRAPLQSTSNTRPGIHWGDDSRHPRSTDISKKHVVVGVVSQRTIESCIRNREATAHETITNY